MSGEILPDVIRIHISPASAVTWKEVAEAIQRNAPSLVIFPRDVLDQLGIATTIEPSVIQEILVQETALTRLTPIESEIVRLVAKGLRNSEIATILNLKIRTLRSKLSDIYRRFEVTNRTELIGMLSDQGGSDIHLDRAKKTA